MTRDVKERVIKSKEKIPSLLIWKWKQEAKTYLVLNPGLSLWLKRY